MKCPLPCASLIWNTFPKLSKVRMSQNLIVVSPDVHTRLCIPTVHVSWRWAQNNFEENNSMDQLTFNWAYPSAVGLLLCSKELSCLNVPYAQSTIQTPFDTNAILFISLIFPALAQPYLCGKLANPDISQLCWSSMPSATTAFISASFILLNSCPVWRFHT